MPLCVCVCVCMCVCVLREIGDSGCMQDVDGRKAGAIGSCRRESFRSR